ncbi:hypothetical protein PYW07_003699 [Mythimna separata]|uniref:RETREG1-3/ARL6IP-like N-terminal reticulon-homology domain-containing protein n=1 Tax=Mythimna separata TaxID=271217 RepID=A0AAD8DUI0_MYTSE|nr:hypothetical protein PYW07_003699 [Mythimna separata]
MAEFIVSPNQEQQVKKLKRFLEGWRMALLPLKSIILWEQQWHPCAIIGSVSFLYTLIWLLDLNSLATFAVIGLFLNFVDFIVPVICNSLYGPSAWTGQHEKTFEEVCKSIVATYNKSLHSIHQFYSLRETSPYMYYILSISLLLTLAWVASSINNIFLMYILSTVMLLTPGVRHRGIFNTLLTMVNMAPKSVKSE